MAESKYHTVKYQDTLSNAGKRTTKIQIDDLEIKGVAKAQIDINPDYPALAKVTLVIMAKVESEVG